MEMFDTFVLTTLTLDKDGNVISTNVTVTFDIHEAEAPKTVGCEERLRDVQRPR